MKLNNIDITVDALSEPLDAELIQELLKSVDLDKKKIKVKRGESSVAIESEKNGVILNFSQANSSQYPEGTLLLSAFHAMANGAQGHQQFRGELPQGLRFDMNRKSVSKLLGKPSWSSADFSLDRWDSKSTKLFVEFFEDANRDTVYSVTTQVND